MRKGTNKNAFVLSDLNAAFAGLSAEERSRIVDALEDDLLKLAGKRLDVLLETLAPKIRERVEVLREIQSAHDELQAKFFEERVELEAKYQKLYEPLYKKRYEIVNGLVEVEGATVVAPEEPLSKDKAPEANGVPNFWLTAMKSHEVLAKTIRKHDEEALKYLKDIKSRIIDNPKGFKLEFFFDTNPYFKNSLLTKTYHIINDDEPILYCAIGTEIEWFLGKSLTQKISKKNAEGSENAKPITNVEDCGSFFDFFNLPDVPKDDCRIMNFKEDTRPKEMEQDYDIGTTIRDKIIPNAVSWYTGEAVEEDGVVELEENS